MSTMQPHENPPPKDRRYLHRPFSKGTPKKDTNTIVTEKVPGTVMRDLSELSNLEIVA